MVVGVFTCLLVWKRHKPSESSNREIASALLEYHSEFKGLPGIHKPESTTNPLPSSFLSAALVESDRGWYEASAEYKHSLWGIDLRRKFELLGNTNDATWTLYEIYYAHSPYVRWLTLKRRLITITNTL